MQESIGDLPIIQNRYLSHPYIAVEELANSYLNDLDDKRKFLIKDIIRCIDSSDYNYLRKFQNKFFSSKITGSKKDLASQISKNLLKENFNYEILKKMQSFFLENKDKNIILPEERNYDEILGFKLNHHHFNQAFKWILNKFKPNPSKNIALFTTCSSVKPYYNSPTFKPVLNYLKENFKKFSNIHWLVISNSCAPIPEELHASFPFYAYESDLRKYTKKDCNEYKLLTINRLSEYLKKNPYDYYVGLIRPNSIQKSVLSIISDKLGINIKFFPSEEIKEKIEALGTGYWCRMGLKFEYTLLELKNYLNEIEKT